MQKRKETYCFDVSCFEMLSFGCFVFVSVFGMFVWDFFGELLETSLGIRCVFLCDDTMFYENEMVYNLFS